MPGDFFVSQSTIAIICALVSFVAYATLCHILRFHNIKALQRKYAFGTPARPDFSSMTKVEAFEIMKEVSDAEFPALFEKGLQLALFRTYGILSISKLLAQTAQLGRRENVAKRYADTSTTILEIYAHPPGHIRSVESYARLNYLHDHYISQNRIKNDDMLYTLAQAMSHPNEWISRYEWRGLTDVEICAIGTFHKVMGESMKISFASLRGWKFGWADGLEFYRDLDDWSKDYEKVHLKPHKVNAAIADRTKELLLSTVPRFTHSIVSEIMSAAMDEPLRKAVMFPPAYPLTVKALNAIMKIRRLFLLHLSLPRFYWQRRRYLSRDTSPDGRSWIEYWLTTPHYVKPTLWNRWGPSGIYQLLIKAPRPGDDGMLPQGYLRSEIGPQAFEGKGVSYFNVEKARQLKENRGDCPFKLLNQ